VLTRQSEQEEQRKQHKQILICLFNMSDKELNYQWPEHVGTSKKILDSKEKEWMKEEVKNLLPNQVIPGQLIKIPPLSVSIYQVDQLSIINN
jgi:hypothetical protein